VHLDGEAWEVGAIDPIAATAALLWFGYCENGFPLTTGGNDGGLGKGMALLWAGMTSGLDRFECHR